MKIEGTITEQDYLGAWWLSMKPRLWIAVVGMVLVILVVAITLISILQRLVGHHPIFDEPFSMLFALAYLGIFFWFLRYLQRRNYRKQKMLSVSFRVSFDAESIRLVNEFVSSTLPWHIFHKWRENKYIFLLYESNAIYLIFPKRLFENSESINEFRRLTHEKIGKAN
jgi:hypothetical protein